MNVRRLEQDDLHGHATKMSAVCSGEDEEDRIWARVPLGGCSRLSMFMTW